MPELFYENGYQAPKIVVWKNGHFNTSGFLEGATIHEVITMPQCTVEGQPESYEANEDGNTLESLEETKRFLGFRYKLTLYYNDLMRGANVRNYAVKLQNYRAKGYVFEVYPNAENFARKFYMNLVSDLDMKLDRNAEDADGYENIILEFRERFVRTQIAIYDPLDIWVPLDNFITLPE